MDEFGLVSSDPPWKWVVQKPVFVTWNHKEEGETCIGQLSPVNGTSRFTINIGWRCQTQELLIVLHLPVSIRSSRHPRDMFVVVPSFNTAHLDLAFTPLQATEGPPALESAGLSETQLFHIPFKLSKPCKVVMPQARREKPIQGTPKELMMKLKSLSETSEFDAYFKFDTYAQVELRNMFAMLPQQLTSPPLMLKTMYAGRGGGFNLWSHQGLCLDQISALKSNGSQYLENKRETNTADDQHDQPPPPYPAINISPSQHVQVPFSDCSDLPTPVPLQSIEADAIRETPSEDRYWAFINRLTEYRSPDDRSPSMQNSQKRVAEVESLSHGKDAHRDKQPRSCQSLLLGQTPAPNFDDLFDSVDPPPPSPTILYPTLPPTHVADVDTANNRVDDIAHWLTTAWTVLPDAHYVLRVELLALGTAVDRAAFANARIEITTRLAFTAARLQSHVPVAAEAMACITTLSDAEDQVRDAVMWINTVKSDGDLLALRSLVALAERAMDVVYADSDTLRDKEKEFYLCKAHCIASVCCLR